MNETNIVKFSFADLPLVAKRTVPAGVVVKTLDGIELFHLFNVLPDDLSVRMLQQLVATYLIGYSKGETGQARGI